MLAYVNTWVLPAAFAQLPPRMDSTEARALVLAIGLQESKFRARWQLPRTPGGRPGPARGFWQFEVGGGVAGVLSHPQTKPHALALCEQQLVTPAATAVWTAIEHNDVLAAGFARLNLWWLSGRLPGRDQADEGWRQYLEAWRPGEPHPKTWPDCYRRAWACVAGDRF